MQLEIGSVVEGKVTGITKFGAFVELPSGKTGMVHISEVAATYVREISDHLSENQVVKVKVLNITPEGKVSLSIKKCLDAQPQQPAGASHDRPQQQSRPPQQRRRDTGWKGFKPSQSADSMSFEDMLSSFKKTSDDKMSDLRRTVDMRKGSGRRGGSSK